MDKNLLDSKKEYKIFFFGLIQIGLARAEARSYVLIPKKRLPMQVNIHLLLRGGSEALNVFQGDGCRIQTMSWISLKGNLQQQK